MLDLLLASEQYRQQQQELERSRAELEVLRKKTGPASTVRSFLMLGVALATAAVGWFNWYNSEKQLELQSELHIRDILVSNEQMSQARLEHLQQIEMERSRLFLELLREGVTLFERSPDLSSRNRARELLAVLGHVVPPVHVAHWAQLLEHYNSRVEREVEQSAASLTQDEQDQAAAISSRVAQVSREVQTQKQEERLVQQVDRARQDAALAAAQSAASQTRKKILGAASSRSTGCLEGQWSRATEKLRSDQIESAHSICNAGATGRQLGDVWRASLGNQTIQCTCKSRS